MSEGEFLDQFIADYYAECEEHITVLRRVLMVVEGNAGTVPLDPVLLAEVARALHTLKGLSGMVGFAEVERLAHALEDWVRQLAPAERPATGRDADLGFHGVRLMEEAILRRQAGGDPLPIDDFLVLLTASGDAAPSPVRRAALPRAASVAAAVAAGRILYEFSFLPTVERAARDVNVEKVRARLLGIGDLISAKPRVVPGGGVAFDFVVALFPGAEPEPAWADDGLNWAPHPASEPSASAPAAAPAGAPERSATQGSATANIVRVDLARLDDLMRHIGELVISRSRLDDALRHGPNGNAAAAWSTLQETNAALERQLRTLREAVMRVRMVPVGEVFERMRFVVRDVAREAGKQVTVELEGQHTEIDKQVVDRMLEPLLHLVRNAISHGIESPEERTAAGKPPAGRLVLRAAAVGDRVSLEVEDDGRGVDEEAVRARASELARAAGHAAPSGALLDLLCLPGFSTRDAADMASGRGVGMAVVRATVAELGGELTLTTRPGQGSCFRIELPLTLMIVGALMVRVGAHLLAVPQPAVREILHVERANVTGMENNQLIVYRAGVLPLLHLRQLFGLQETKQSSFHVLVVGTDGSPVGLVADKVTGLREIVVRPVEDPLVAVPGIAGATELADGTISLILDTLALARIGRERQASGPRRVAAGALQES